MEDYWNPMVPELSVTDVANSLVFYRTIGFLVRFRRADPDGLLMWVAQPLGLRKRQID
jgi:hypothetical protein